NEVTNQMDYLTADGEGLYVVAQDNGRCGDDGGFVKEEVLARFRGETTVVRREKLDYVDVSPKQGVSAATGGVQCVENDDCNRAVMAANMQRQAVPFIDPKAPIVGTGMEYVSGKDSGAAIISEHDGIVESVEAKEIAIRKISEVDGKEVEGDLVRYGLRKYIR